MGERQAAAVDDVPRGPGEADAGGWAADLAPLTGWTSKADAVASVLRKRVTEGRLRPDERLSEEEVCRILRISRNTLREAFRMLTHERLLEHRPGQGVFVRRLTVEDVADLFRLRRLLEPAAVREVRERPAGLDRLAAAVAEAESPAAKGDWRALGTANMHFHQALVALAGSPRADELMGRVLAELRLVFHVMPDMEDFHEAYRARNRHILGLLERGEGQAAADYLTGYLDDAERELVAEYRKVADGR
ncbi:GntR family transcriptional regulator [Kitasatospora sp. NPDC101183]|uniref:GntR family transcriptional regulator n=1 Tax=Kitasatospora sp. NPDC101183 TaxID=3364100 RepID=UPI003805E835